MAKAPDDYTAIDDTYTIEPHMTELPVTVEIVSDDLDEHHERFSVSLSNEMYVDLGDSYAVGTSQGRRRPADAVDQRREGSGKRGRADLHDQSQRA